MVFNNGEIKYKRILEKLSQVHEQLCKSLKKNWNTLIKINWNDSKTHEFKENNKMTNILIQRMVTNLIENKNITLPDTFPSIEIEKIQWDRDEAYMYNE